MIAGLWHFFGAAGWDFLETCLCISYSEFNARLGGSLLARFAGKYAASKPISGEERNATIIK
ncbi:MAG: hypothetical protein MKZ59_06895, partial [Deinococcales bacterium]|nr:hypothetical protein [Deinococcales bacterium]